MADEKQLEGDSLEYNDCELERIKSELKLKDKCIQERQDIINALRLDNSGLREDYEELEKTSEIQRQKIDRLERQAEENQGDIDSLSHALNEAQRASEGIQAKLDKRTEQLHSAIEDLAIYKKDLDLARQENQQLTSKNKELTLETIKLKTDERGASRLRYLTEENEALKQEIQQLRNKLARPQSINTAGIHFSIADEIGEMMDSSSLSATINKRSHDGYPAPAKRTSKLNNESKHPANNYCINHQMKKLHSVPIDPIAEEKMRLDRAKELARRNMQTKPLHQTSYPLELDTFDTTDLTETEIKRGRVTRPPVPEARRLALADSSNQRKPVKKAEAFIV